MTTRNITYLGSFDDRVTADRKWQDLNIRTLNEILVSELIFSTNSKIVINDGYIVNSPIFQKALWSVEKNSHEKLPLISMIKNEYIQILTRNNSLVEMVEKMARQGNTSFKELKKKKGWEIALEKLDEDIKQCYIPWPKFDLGEGFINLMKYLLKQDPKNLNLSLDSDSYKKLSEQFQKSILNDNQGPRDKWEKVIAQNEHKMELMKIANRAYHYNFGMCLQEDNFKEENVFVNSIASNLFLEKTVEPQETDCDFSKLNFRLPEKVQINDNFISALRTGGDLCGIHIEFMAAYSDYINGGSEQNLKNKQLKFKEEIISFDKANRSKEINPERDFTINLGWSAAGGALGTQFPDPLVSVFTTVAVSALGPLTNSGISLFKGLYRYRGRKYNLIYHRNKATIDAFKLNRMEAKKHTKELSCF